MLSSAEGMHLIKQSVLAIFLLWQATDKLCHYIGNVWSIVLQNVELQNAELQNAEFQNIELQNAELQNAELQNVESYRMSNLTKRRNTKRRILQNVEIQYVDNTKRRKWLAWMVNMFWNTNLL